MHKSAIHIVLGEYKALFRVWFRHKFYQSGWAGDIMVAPTAECRQLLHDYGLLFRKTQEGFAVVCKESSWKSQQVGELLENNYEEFSFVLSLDNPFFLNYTDLPFRNEGKIYEFSNSNGRLRGDKFVLHPTSFVKHKDLVPLTGDLQVEMASTGVKRMPFGILRISSDEGDEGYRPVKGGQVNSPDYYVVFKAREAYWRYLLPKEHIGGELSNIRVYDNKKMVDFLEIETIRIKGGREVLAAQSANKIPFEEQPSGEILFRAKRRKNGTGRLVSLVLDLPIPSYKKLNPVDEESVYADVIFSL